MPRPLVIAFSLLFLSGARGVLAQSEENHRGELVFPKTTTGCAVGSPLKNSSLPYALSLTGAVTTSWSGECVDGFVSGAGTLEGKLGNVTQIEYTGMMRNGLFNGQGTFRSAAGVTVSGIWQDGFIDGPIELSINGHPVYVGGWKIDRRDGYGVDTPKDGSRYEGDWRDGKKEGHGILNWPTGARFDGTWHNDKKEGNGKMLWPNGNRYEGNWHDDQPSGLGVLSYGDDRQAVYEGEFRDGKEDGHGVLTSSNGLRAEGEWQQGVANGHMVIVGANGDRFDGGVRGMKKNGFGIYVRNDRSRYEGEWHDDRPNGTGTLVAKSGARYEGTFRDGLPDGQGTLVRPDTPPFVGLWSHGCFKAGDRVANLGVELSTCVPRLP